MNANEPQSQPEEARSDPHDYAGPGEGEAEGEPPGEDAGRLHLADEDVTRLARQVAEEGDRMRRTYRGVVFSEGVAERFRKTADQAQSSFYRRQMAGDGTGKQEPSGTSRFSEDFSHNDDYSSVKLHGQAYLLQGRAADVVKTLHEALRSGHPWVHKDHIAVELIYDAEL